MGGSLSVGTGIKTYPCMAYLALATDKNPNTIKSAFVTDFHSGEQLNPHNAFFVLNSHFHTTCSKYPIVAFKDKRMANSFASYYGGDVRDFDFALFVAKKDLEVDEPILTLRMLREVSQGQTPLSPKKTINVPVEAKCLVCGMFVRKYPKWTTQMVTRNKENHYFDGVKDMMKFYFEPSAYHHHYTFQDFTHLFVSDYYTLEKIEAREAFFVSGSDVYGPMGHELIPFKKEADAIEFSQSHKGKKVLPFGKITQQIVRSLDQ